ncbi:MAG: hypothetical protein ACI9YO_003312, partial [Gammaproteobacteria bacterium]
MPQLMLINLNILLKGRRIMSKGQMLQEPYLNALRREHVPVSIFLVNGI